MTKRIKRINLLGTLLIGWSCLLLLTAVPARAEERILSFHSDITINPDASLTVTETIKVRAENNQIKRGIYRDFPTRYRGKYGLTRRTGFQVRQVLREGKPEPFHFQGISVGKRVYIGQKEVILDPGEYTYTLVYATDRQLGFFPDFDELYWNVTGNDWKFPIDRASATVHLPEGSGGKIMAVAGYTGPKGARGRDFEKEIDPYRGTVSFYTTEPLAVHEGLTVAVSWPKGFVTEPSGQSGLWALVRDNRGFLFGLLGILIILVYYLFVWSRVGRDPEKGVIVIRYGPPGDLSPAALRYIWNQGYDDKTFTAAVIDLAVKGRLNILERDDKYAVRQRGDQPKMPVSQDEEKVYSALFNQRQEVWFDKPDRTVIQSAVSALKRNLEYGYEKDYFVHNRWHFVIGLLLTLAVVFVSGIRDALDQGSTELFLFLSFWLTVWSLGVALVVAMAAKAWQEVFSGSGKLKKITRAFSVTFFALPFVAGEVVGLYLLAFKAASLPLALLYIVSLLVTVVFYQLLKAVTPQGRKRLDEIEGFRIFLEATEKDRLNFLNPPDRTPELFEKFLPYALALGVEQLWAEQFTEILAAAWAEGRSLSWYSSTNPRGFSASNLASSFGDSLASAVASSSGSSSGSGGGGSSGGGGGGGGGGGW
ncbi:MAG: DUF2207 domain-containing protein [Deltaproteobacteria bacterium]|nr:DUF2207 domain-containing protein [Deltaproteobacteria bacterium]